MVVTGGNTRIVSSGSGFCCPCFLRWMLCCSLKKVFRDNDDNEAIWYLPTRDRWKKTLRIAIRHRTWAPQQTPADSLRGFGRRVTTRAATIAESILSEVSLIRNEQKIYPSFLLYAYNRTRLSLLGIHQRYYIDHKPTLVISVSNNVKKAAPLPGTLYSDCWLTTSRTGIFT